MSSDDDYQCQLTPESLEKAIKELNEDPKNRLGAVDTLRTWITQQPHLRCSTDTAFLLQFLRYCKFSQLESRRRLQKYLSMVTTVPEWLADIDTTDPDVTRFLKTQYIVPLGTDDEGRYVLMYRVGQLDTTLDKSKMYKSILGFTKLILRDENAFVNGLLFVCDMTGMTMKHQTYFGMDDMKKNFDIFQNALAARFKGFHYYNIGPVAETILQLVMPLFKKKFRERITMHGDNLESLYKSIPMRLLPQEYLPDDYTGPNNGTLQSINDALIRRMQEPQNAAYVARITDSKHFGLDEAKRPKKEDAVPQASFRKLNID